jgi:hypothetical protein
VAVNDNDAGVTLSTGGSGGKLAVVPYADNDPSLYAVPVPQVVGREVRVPEELVSAWVVATGASRNRIVPEPVGPRIAIQYVVPLVTAAPVVRLTSFHRPATGVTSDPCASSPPGCPEPFAYNPATSFEALEEAST